MSLIYIKSIQLQKSGMLKIAAVLFFLVLGFSCFLDYGSSPVTSWAMSGRVIVIDPGHGGIDPGAVGYQQLKEKEIVLELGKRLKKVFNQAGARVIMTRESDIDLSSSNSGSLLKKKREDLGRRVELAHKNNADLFLSIHVNAFPSSKWYGAQTFYQSKNEEGKMLAESIQAELIRIMGNTTRTAKAGDFYTTRNLKIPSVIIEIGFISNPREAKLLNDDEYQEKLAYAIYSGVVKYYSEKLKS